MKIQKIMTTNVECISPDASVAEVAKRMKTHDIGSVPVCENEEKLIGMVTDRDIVVRCIAEGRDLNSTTARDIMTTDIIYCCEDQDVTEMAEVMEERKIRRVVVLNEDKKLVGIVSLGDMAVKTQNDSLCNEALEAVSAPA
ncbi:Hypoxic response protein 1 [Polystyrenella longa]|uniref:Hypoxic response protein 1 n=1 Tax=Polystyrenella longa TaxID=2528007 RepID=A0A518CPP5_9PLAN|nr:CBS domain-containing protein [Polystyrenella longa]QDU81192.1 Hypoxic response protein 1 [Polystyrenella longa]